MAGEKKGKAYEALVHVALKELVDDKKLAGPLHWNVTPKGMSIEPDFVTGSDPDNPETILLLNHSNAAGNSHMKFWRNLGELVEAKTVLPTIPRVYCLTFGIIKADLEPIQQHGFDQFVWVRNATHPWADELDAFVAAGVGDFPKGKHLQTAFMRDQLQKASGNARAAYQELKSLLEVVFKAKSVTLDKMWADHRARTSPSIPAARNTYLRRGISKLSIFEDPGTVAGEAIVKNMPEYALRLKLAEKRVGGYVIRDPEVVSAIRMLGGDGASALVSDLRSDRVEGWLFALRSSDALGIIANYLLENYERLVDKSELLTDLKKLHADPTALIASVPEGVVWPPPSVWLFEAVMQVLRIGSGAASGFGYAQLGSFVVQKYNLRRRDGSLPRIWVGGFVVSDWVHRRNDDRISREELEMICDILSEHIRKIGRSSFEKAVVKFAEDSASHILETKLIPYRMFDPLRVLIERAIPSGAMQKVAVCFREAAGMSGQSGVMRLFFAKKTLINWQSCSDAGRDHKKKELCGRAIGLRYHWDGSEFIRRPGVQKMILVLDGTWRQKDLNALIRAGWDEIYYPDEMDQLANAIV